MKNEIITLNTTEAVETASKVVEEIASTSQVVVNSQPTLDKAKEKMVEVKSIRKLVVEKKESLTKPLNEALKNARALFKPLEDNLNAIEDNLKSGILKYNQKLLAEQRKREEEAQRKLAEELQAGKDLEEVNIEKLAKPVSRIEEKLEQIETRKIKKLRIINEELIPRAFLTPDEVRIKKALMNGEKVEGCELYEEEIIVNSY